MKTRYLQGSDSVSGESFEVIAEFSLCQYVQETTRSTVSYESILNQVPAVWSSDADFIDYIPLIYSSDQVFLMIPRGWGVPSPMQPLAPPNIWGAKFRVVRSAAESPSWVMQPPTDTKTAWPTIRGGLQSLVSAHVPPERPKNHSLGLPSDDGRHLRPAGLVLTDGTLRAVQNLTECMHHT